MTWSKNTLTTPFIGNDVVDLSAAQSGFENHRERFAARVCTPLEQAILKKSNHQDITLWAIWAAKEAAYKIALRLDETTSFIKQRFEVDAPFNLGLRAQCSGLVQYNNARFPVRWSINGECIHCFGIWSEHIELDNVIAGWVNEEDIALKSVSLTERERQSVRSVASSKVRQLAKQLLCAEGHKDVEVVRQRHGDHWRAPRLWRNNKELTPSAVSLSHHGRFVAVAMWLPPS